VPIIDRTQVHDCVALPGDPELDCDLTGIVVVSVVSLDAGQEILIRLTGGTGRWMFSDTGESVDVANVTSADLRARFVGMPDRLWRDIVGQLECWRDAATSLWFGAAPGKASALIEDPDHYMFLPRRSDPLENP
jgi:hypothetical protein